MATINGNAGKNGAENDAFKIGELVTVLDNDESETEMEPNVLYQVVGFKKSRAEIDASNSLLNRVRLRKQYGEAGSKTEEIEIETTSVVRIDAQHVRNVRNTFVRNKQILVDDDVVAPNIPVSDVRSIERKSRK